MCSLEKRNNLNFETWIRWLGIELGCLGLKYSDISEKFPIEYQVLSEPII